MFETRQLHGSGVSEPELFKTSEGVPNLALADWERALYGKCALRHPEWNWFARHQQNGRLLGASLGGRGCGTGCVNHIWVVPGEQCRRIGARMLADLISQAAHQVRRIYLVTTRGNNRANDFWEREGFRRRRPSIEIDIEPNRKAPEEFSPCRLDCSLMNLLETAFLEVRERALVVEDLTSEHAVAFPLRDSQGLCGALLVTQMGFRGFVRCVLRDGRCSPDRDSVDIAFQSAFAYLSHRGLLRIHALQEGDLAERETDILFQGGFSLQDGETTFERLL